MSIPEGNAIREGSLQSVFGLIIGLLLIAWAAWWFANWFRKGDKREPLRWGNSRRPGPPMSRFGELDMISILVAVGLLFVLGGYLGKVSSNQIPMLMGPPFALALVALAFDSVVEIIRRRRDPERLRVLQATTKPFKKRAHAYTVAAATFGFLAFLLIKVSMDNWNRFPPRFFEGDGNNLINAWLPAICGIIELFPIIQAIRYWITELAQPPGADYLEYPEDDSDG